MKRILLAILLSVAAGIATYSTTLWYFQWRTGYPLLEVFDVKDRCKRIYKTECVMIYYYFPNSGFKVVPFKAPKTHTI